MTSPAADPIARFSAASVARLIKVHKDLQAVMMEARLGCLDALGFEFEITEGIRTLERQKHLLAIKATRTLDSRHLTGHAVDVVCMVKGKVRWDTPLYVRLAEERILPTAARLSIPVIWGGSWKTFFDGPHYELNRTAYP